MSSAENNLGVSEHPSEKPEVSISLGNHKVTSPLSPDQFSSLKGFLSNHKHGIRIAMELGLVALSAKLLMDSHKKDTDQPEPVNDNASKVIPLTDAEAHDFENFFVLTQRNAVGVVMGRMKVPYPTPDVYDNVSRAYEGLARNWPNYYPRPTKEKEFILWRTAVNTTNSWLRDDIYHAKNANDITVETAALRQRRWSPSAEDEALERLEPDNGLLKAAMVKYLSIASPKTRLSAMLYVAGLESHEVGEVLGEEVTEKSDRIKSRWRTVKTNLRKIAQDPLAYLEGK